ncbi:MAG: ABC transporter ATP-binding protein [Eubacterium sp.]|nr:ABC transporter ATP-binding protein [Eubacterium sp.]
MKKEEPILELKHLSLFLAEAAKADQCLLRDVTMAVPRGKITCLVGESGSGKSMTIASILGLTPRAAYFGENSSILFRGEAIFSIFQDPMNAFNPSQRVASQLYAMARGYRDIKKEAFEVEFCEILSALSFENPGRVLRQYPFELSGGMLQRLMIGCGILIKPALMIADEPTTALDVTVQKDILKTLVRINKTQGTTILLVTHDFGVVAEIADEVAVMQRGRIVECGDVFTIFDHPREDYTRQLIQATFKGGDVQC